MCQIPLTGWTSICCQIPPLEQRSDTFYLSQAVNALQRGSLSYYDGVKVCASHCWTYFVERLGDLAGCRSVTGTKVRVLWWIL